MVVIVMGAEMARWTAMVMVMARLRVTVMVAPEREQRPRQ